jgi:hypothetical protein
MALSNYDITPSHDKFKTHVHLTINKTHRHCLVTLDWCKKHFDEFYKELINLPNIIMVNAKDADDLLTVVKISKKDMPEQLALFTVNNNYPITMISKIILFFGADAIEFHLHKDS